jgi:hypothetical protein
LETDVSLAGAEKMERQERQAQLAEGKVRHAATVTMEKTVKWENRGLMGLTYHFTSIA